MGELPQRPVVGVQQDRRDDALPQRRGDPHVVVVGVRADDRLDPAVPDDRHDALDVVGRVDDHALHVVADHPDVVVDVMSLPVQGERALRDPVVDARPGAHRITTRAEYVAVVHLLEGGLDVADADLLGDERVEVEPALLVEVDQHREVTGGQAVAVPARLQRAAAPEHVDEREVGDLHVRGRHPDQDDRAGQVAGVERLLPRLGAADRVDHHVGAEAAGELLDRGHRVLLTCCSRCAWRPSRAPTRASGRRGRRR